MGYMRLPTKRNLAGKKDNTVDDILVTPILWLLVRIREKELWNLRGGVPSRKLHVEDHPTGKIKKVRCICVE